MAPNGLMSFLGRSLSVFCNSSLRSTSVFSANFNHARCLTSQLSGPPKRPLNGYMRYVQTQKPMLIKENPELKAVDLIRKIAQQWRSLSPELKKPFQDASVQAREQFKVDLQKYQSQLSPAQLHQQTVEKKQRLAKRKAIRKKRELTSLGKPKRPRTAFNIFMSEHFVEARGTSTQAKMKSLLEDWRNLLGHQKKVYTQLAEDDKVRYKNEMKSWEDHMVEIGREDLVREQTLYSKKMVRLKPATKPLKKTAKPKAKAKKTRTSKAGGAKAAASRKKT